MRGERTHSAGGGPRGEEGVMSLGEEVTSRERGRGMASLGEGGGIRRTRMSQMREIM